MPIDHAISKLTEADLNQVNHLIRQRLKSHVDLINQIADHIIEGGGKRIRPLLVLLTSKALGQCQHPHYLTAAIIELIHTATLLHDDVIDNSNLRRGRPTANTIWDNTATVLTGDYLYSRAFEMMVDIGDLSVLEILATSSNLIATGELKQLSHAHHYDLTEEDYFKTIELKTAQLFEAACLIPAQLNEQNDTVKQACRHFGRHLGNAFQVADDIIDYLSTSDTMGKNAGDDLQEGKMTLPLIYAYQTASQADKTLIQQAIQRGDKSNLDRITQIIQQSGSLERCQAKSKHIANDAKACLTHLPDNEYTHVLSDLVDQAVSRVS